MPTCQSLTTEQFSEPNAQQSQPIQNARIPDDRNMSVQPGKEIEAAQLPAIVMTATIVPNAIQTAHADAMLRRAEYLEAIEFYSQFGEVYFLENSSYDVEADPAFRKHSHVHLRKFPPSTALQKGKGYQEFEMLDEWLATEPSPPSRWIKVTGRHLTSNFDKVFAECRNEDQYQLLIEQKRPPSSVALTDLFYVTTAYYRQHFRDIYRECDDAKRVYIEHVVRQHIQHSDKFKLFREMPLLTGTSGSTGEVFDITPKRRLQRLIGKWLYRLNKKYRYV